MIWAIKQGDAKLPEARDKNRHWFSNWLPQVELLGHPAVQTGVTHCGFGGTCEFINAGVPLLTFPHFSD